MTLVHNLNRKDTISKRIWLSLAILIVFGLCATFPMVLTSYAIEHKVWLLHDMNIEPNFFTTTIVVVCLLAIALAGFIGTILGLFMIGDILLNGFDHTFHVFEEIDEKIHHINE